MAKTRIFLKEQGIGSMEELREKADTAASEFDRIAKDLKAAEQRLVEIAALKKHIVNYAKTRDAYIAYRKAWYSLHFARKIESQSRKTALRFQMVPLTGIEPVRRSLFGRF